MIYNYKGDVCAYEYQEGREETEPQWVTKCPVTGCEGTLQSA